VVVAGVERLAPAAMLARFHHERAAAFRTLGEAGKQVFGVAA
jgi:hypothetical protein